MRMSSNTPETTKRLQDIAGIIQTQLANLNENVGRINKRTLKNGFLAALVLAGIFTTIKRFKTKPR